MAKCNLVTVNLETSLAGQQPHPSWGGRLSAGWLPSLQGHLHVHCLLCLADHYGSVCFKKAPVAVVFCALSTHPCFQVSMRFGTYSTENFSVMVPAGWHLHGCHGYLQCNSAFCAIGPSTLKAPAPKRIFCLTKF